MAEPVKVVLKRRSFVTFTVGKDQVEVLLDELSHEALARNPDSEKSHRPTRAARAARRSAEQLAGDVAGGPETREREDGRRIGCRPR